jgi:PEGA domain
MNFNRILTPAAVLATLSLAVTPAFAGQHSGGHSHSSSASRGSSRGSAARSAAPSRTYSGQSRSYSAQSRSYGSTPRAAIQSRGVYAAQSRGGGFARVAPRGFVLGGVFVAPSRFYRPYYTFRPRLSLGFGLWAGYPIAYSYPYYYGYPYPYDPYDDPAYYPPPAYSYPVPNPSSAYPPANYPQSGQSGYYESDPPRGTSVTAQPGTASGGISFEISPATAEVYIDGTYVGRVSELGPTTQPLALTPGRHHVEIRAAGYQTMVMDSDVTAGQVIPYQGTMQPAR